MFHPAAGTTHYACFTKPKSSARKACFIFWVIKVSFLHSAHQKNKSKKSLSPAGKSLACREESERIQPCANSGQCVWVVHIPEQQQQKFKIFPVVFAHSFTPRKHNPFAFPESHTATPPREEAHSPKSDSTPQADQNTSDMPTLPVFWSMPLGEMKMPDPMTVPMMMETPLSKVIFFFRTTFSCPGGSGSPMEGSLPLTLPCR